MIQEAITITEKHRKFITAICETGVVFGLSSDEGFAISDSNDFEDEKGDPVEMICFWSDTNAAKVCAKKNWEHHEPAVISLSEFIEDWCVGMYNDGLLVATGFDHNLIGYEANPLVLILEIIKELELMKKTVLLTKFENLLDLESQINIILNLDAEDSED